VAYKQMTPSDVVIENVKVYMRWRDLNQEDLADRMTMIGMGFDKKGGGKTTWHRRTVGQMLNGHRRIDVNELFGLALALETTVGALLSPGVEAFINFDVQYRIGDLEPLPVHRFTTLLESPKEKASRPRLVIGDWSPERRPGDGSAPPWKAWPRARMFDDMQAALADGGWEDEDEFLDANPDVSEVPVSQLVTYIEQHQKGDSQS
jgi:transcriptional regulator with XRE-family HTH domain